MRRFVFDPTSSRVSIAGRSSVHPIHSETTGVEGWFEADVDADGVNMTTPPTARLEIGSDRFKSGNPLLDREMRRRIGARHHPRITGAMTSIAGGPAPNTYTVSGVVTFRGVERNYEDEVTITVLDARTLQLQGTHEFDVRNFGMEPPRLLTLRVYPEVIVTIDIVAGERPSPA
jgi:polyisoprenoid-binding protein YceI